jgi:hypothetical protein
MSGQYRPFVHAVFTKLLLRGSRYLEEFSVDLEPELLVRYRFDLLPFYLDHVVVARLIPNDQNAFRGFDHPALFLGISRQTRNAGTSAQPSNVGNLFN